MADYGSIRAGLATVIGNATGLNTYPVAPGAISPPCAVIVPGRPAIMYGQTMGTDISVYGAGEVTVNLMAIIIMSAANESSGQDVLDSYISSSGTHSVNAAVNANPTLGGTVEFAVLLAVQQYGIIEYAGQPYMGASITIQAGAHL